MRKLLVFDADRSLASIGSSEFQEEVFGFPPIPCDSLQDFKRFIEPLLVVEEREQRHPLLQHVTGTEFVTTFNPRAKELGLSALAMDSFSHMCKRTFRLIVKEKQGKEDPDYIDRGVWFDFRDYSNRILSGIARMDIPIIVNCHVKTQEGTTGDELVPGVVTDLRSDIPQYFDVVLYADHKKVDGKQVFFWHTMASGRYVNAKIRHPKVRARFSGEMPQDLNLLLAAFEEEGKSDPKVLILGNSGYGKTSALATVNGYYPPEFKQKEVSVNGHVHAQAN